jgi:hypothetical protein
MCNCWQASTGEWYRLAADDIIEVGDSISNGLRTSLLGPFLFARAILRRTTTFLTNTFGFGIKLSTGVCVPGVVHMPGDPKQCREHAKRCWALASEISNPVLKESLTDVAQRWAVLAAELETMHSLLEALEEPEKKAG